jgi:hypothetical protein
MPLHLLRAGVLRRERTPPGHRRGRVLALGMEHLGDAEVQQLGDAVGRDQDVEWLDVPVHDQMLVRVAHRPGHLKKQLQPLAHAQRVGIGVGIDRLSIDVLHHEERLAVLGGTAIQEPGNVGVLEGRQDLPLGPEPGDHLGGVHSPLDELDRDLLLEQPVRTSAQVDRAHAPPAQLSHRPVGAEAAADGRRLVLIRPRAQAGDGGVLDDPGGPLVRGKESVDLFAERLVSLAGGVQEFRALGPRLLDRRVKEGLQPLPAFAAHRGKSPVVESRVRAPGAVP